MFCSRARPPAAPRPAVADGKRLASSPVEAGVPYYEQLRANRIQRAALETPTMAGIRWAWLLGGGGN